MVDTIPIDIHLHGMDRHPEHPKQIINSFCWHVTTLALWRIMVALVRLHVLAERTVSSFSTWWMQLVVRSAEPQGLHRCCSRCSLTWCDQRRLPMLALQTAGTIPVVLFGTAKSSLAFSVRDYFREWETLSTSMWTGLNMFTSSSTCASQLVSD